MMHDKKKRQNPLLQLSTLNGTGKTANSMDVKRNLVTEMPGNGVNILFMS
jgi:hypothetical protein